MSGSSGNTVADFLVGLAYQETGRRDFTAGLEEATKKAAVLGVVLDKLADAAINAGVKIAASVTGMIAQLDSLFFASQRTGASVASIQAIGFAVSQLGGSVEGARASFEGLGRFLRTNPAGESFIQSLGVRTRETNGQLRDMGAVFVDLGTKLKDMPQFQALQIGSLLGIDEPTILAMIAGVGDFSKVYRGMLASAGIDSQKAAKDANFFSTEVRTLGAAFQVLQEKVASLLTRAMGNDIRRFRELMVANFESMSRAIVWVVDKFMVVAEAVGTLAGRAVEAAQDIASWWGNLSQSSRNLIEAFGAILLAWRVLNAGFLATPLGIIASLGVAILGLYDDYKVWKSGGQSLIDWAVWEPPITAAWTAIKDLAAVITDTLLPAFQGMFSGNLSDQVKQFFQSDLVEMVNSVAEALKSLATTLTLVVELFSALASRDMSRIRAAGQALAGQLRPAGAEVAPDAEDYDTRSVYQRFAPKWAGGKAVSTADKSLPAEARGLLDTIAGTESPEYNVMYGNKKFGSYAQHPNEAQTIMSGPNRGQTTTAAGRYQFLKSTWDEAQKALNLPDFSPVNQDKAAWWLAKRDYQSNTGRVLGNDLKSDDPTVKGGIGRALSKTWTSLPGGIEAGTNTSRFGRELDAATARNQAEVEKLRGLGAGALTGLEKGPDAAAAAQPLTTTDLERARGLRPGTLTDIERAAAAGGQGINNRIDLTGLGTTQPLGVGSNDNSTTHAPTLNQTTTINVQGGGPDVGRQVMEGQRTTNQDAIRALSNKAR